MNCNRYLLAIITSTLLIEVKAQVFEQADKGSRENVMVAEGFWKHWFFQIDLDMTLQNPYGYDFSEVFPNGKTFGVDLAVGKWFTHQVGFRGKFNWENKLPLLKNGHANWLAPFDQPGENRRKGGYIAMYGDALINLHNLFGQYRYGRTWNLSLYPRIGVNYNFGVTKGALVAGIGVLNTYRLSDRWSVYADVAYMMTGSGFVGKNKTKGTGTGANSNGYFSIGVGAQMELGAQKKEIHSSYDSNSNNNKTPVLTNGIWDNWFVQGGIDMSLMNPYGCNFSQVIPKGMTFGLNASMGKWFAPEFALRGRVQWDNGLIENKSLEWVPPVDNPSQNYKKGGLAAISLDAMLNLTNSFNGYYPDKKWHTLGFVRAGIITQFAEGSGSPLFGVGIEETYKINNKTGVFCSVGYQVTTSESSVSQTELGGGSNGYFDVDFGVVIDLGRNLFYRDVESKKKAYSQPLNGHNWGRFAVNTLGSIAVSYVGKTMLKAVIKEERPDHSDNKSFPSGHAAMAFAAARSIDKEFRKNCIWIPIAGYTAATAISVERVVNDKHHWYDVMAGAGVGIGAAELTWWLSDKLFGKDYLTVCTNGNAIDVVCIF